MKFNFIYNFIFNFSIYAESLLAIIQLSIFLSVIFIANEKKYLKSLIVLFLLVLMIATPFSFKFSSILICDKIFEKPNDQCALISRKQNGEKSLVIRFSNNFKNQYNGYNVIDKKLGHFNSKDTFEVIIHSKNIEFEIFNSDILEELLVKKDRISKMRDDYFLSKKEGSL